MTRLISLFVLLVAALANQARGDFAFDTGIIGGSNPSTYCYAGGDNAITEQVSCSIQYQLDVEEGTASIWTSVVFSGSFGEYNPNNPWQNNLLNNGLNTYGSFSQTSVDWDGQEYQFNNVFNLNVSGFAGLYWDEDSSHLYGKLNNHVYGYGAIIPTSTNVSIWINDAGWEFGPDWQVVMTSQWDVVGGFSAVPGPGALALLGLGGCFGRRGSRRRQS